MRMPDAERAQVGHRLCGMRGRVGVAASLPLPPSECRARVELERACADERGRGSGKGGWRERQRKRSCRWTRWSCSWLALGGSGSAA